MLRTIKSKILEETSLTKDVKKFVLSIPEDFNFKAGQYVLLELTTKGKIQRRAYSIASDGLNPKHLELCVKKIIHEGFAHELFKLKKNSEIKLIGPVGKFFIKEKPKKDLVFISVGTGIAPFKSMIEYLLQELKFKKSITLIQGYRHKKDILYKDYFSNLEKKYKNFKQHIILSQPEKPNPKTPKGHVQDFIEKLIKDPEKKSFYVCGMKEMTHQVSEKLHSLKIKPEDILFEKYD